MSGRGTFVWAGILLVPRYIDVFTSIYTHVCILTIWHRLYEPGRISCDNQ